MAEASKTRRRLKKSQLVIGLAILVLFVAAAWYFNSLAFRDRVRRQIITTIEEGTGGRTSIDAIDWNISKLELVLHDVVIHGREAAGEAPFARIERVYLRAHLLSWRTLRLTYAEADRPALHLITYPDGTTNAPEPGVAGVSAGPNAARDHGAIATLFDVEMDRAEVHDGVLLVNNDAIPLDVAADGIRARLDYSAPEKHFNGSLDITKLDATYHNLRPFSASAHAEFTLAQQELTIRSATLTSDGSQLTAHGALTDFADPHVALTFEGKLDLTQAAAITRTPGLRGGTAILQGNSTYYAGQYRAGGTANVNGVQYRLGSAQIAGVNATANFEANNSGLQLKDVRGTALGGRFEGSASLGVDLVVRGRMHQRTVEERGAADVRFSGIDVQRLQAAIARKGPVRLQARGMAAGSISARWVGEPEDATAEITMNVTPPAAAARGEVPVSAALHTTYDGRSGNFSIQQLQVTMPSSRVQASGALGKVTALRVTVNTRDFPELQAALADLGVDFTIPAEIHGALDFTGGVVGTMAEPALSGHVVVTDFVHLAEFTPQTIQTSTKPSQPGEAMRVHWDRLVGDLQYSSRGVSLRNATLEAGGARLTLNGSAALSNGHVMPESHVDLTVNVQNGDAQHLATLLGMTSPVRGVVNGNAHISGAAGNPAGIGAGHLTNIPMGAQMASASSSFTLRDHQLQFSSLDIVRGSAHVTGAAGYNLLTDAFTFSVHGGVIDLAKTPEAQSARVTLAGKLTFAAQGSGTRAAPEINGTLHVSDLVINGESVGDLNAQAVTRNGAMQLSASTTAATAQLTVNGTVQLRGDFPVTLEVKFPHLDFDPLLRAYLRGRLTGHSLAAGTAQVSGPLKRPRELTVDGKVEQFSVAIEKLDLHNTAPVHFRVANEVLTLDEFHIAGSDTEFTASGAVPFAPDRSMDLRAQGSVDLALIQALNPNFTSVGKVTLDMRAQGTFARPSLTGTVQVANASIAYIDLPNGLSEVNGTLMFDQNRLVVQKLTGQSGGGALTLGGYVAYANGLSFAVNAQADQMRLRYPPGTSALANANIRWTGTPQSSTVAGDITLTRFSVSPQFDFATYLARAAQSTSGVALNTALNTVRLDLHLVSTPALQVSSSLAKVSGDLDLRVRGTLADPSVLGRVNIARGTIYFNGTKYQLERGDITFVNPTAIEPVMNVNFTTRIAGYDINLSLDGPLDHLHTTYRSDPPLPSTDIISLLAFRQCPTSATFTCSPSAVEQAETYSTGASTSFTETASNEILGEALNATLSNRVQKLFGISRVKISPEIATAIGNPSARITIEQQVSNNITITYVTDVAQAQQQVIQVEYNINRNLSVVAVRDQFGVLSFDVRIRRRKR